MCVLWHREYFPQGTFDAHGERKEIVKLRLSRSEIAMAACVICGALLGRWYWFPDQDLWGRKLAGFAGAVIGLGVYAFIAGLIAFFRRS
jgi:prolipoprotein diacylglyceryltransferase